MTRLSHTQEHHDSHAVSDFLKNVGLSVLVLFAVLLAAYFLNEALIRLGVPIY